MHKIPTVFVRDSENRKALTREVTPGCEWVFAGEGNATRKYDGTCCLIREGKFYKRYEIKWKSGNGSGEFWAVSPDGSEWHLDKPTPDGFEAASEIDLATGKQQGWVPVGEGPEDKYHREAWSNYLSDLSEQGVEITPSIAPSEGTYELVGPKIQGNPEKYKRHELVPHEQAERYPAMNKPSGYDELATALSTLPWEGIVWHHPDGRMAKLKKRDFSHAS